MRSIDVEDDKLKSPNKKKLIIYLKSALDLQVQLE